MELADPRAPGRPGAVAPGRGLLGALRRPWDEQRPVVVAYLILALLIALYAFLQPGALSIYELNIQVNTALALIFVTAGQVIVMTCGGLDLSVGAVVSLATCVAATTMDAASSSIVWSVAIIAIGALVGLVNGLLVAFLRLSSFIVTLATWSIVGGLALLVLESPGGSVPISFVTTLTDEVGSIGVPVLILAGGICLWLWARKTRTMTRIRAVGSDAEAARLAGISVARVQVTAFALSGALAATGGLFLTTQLGSGDPLVGNSFVLQSVAAAVIGGTALTGGRGDVLGGVAGALTLTLLGSVVFALELPSYWQVIAAGLMLLIAAFANVILNRGREGEA